MRRGLELRVSGAVGRADADAARPTVKSYLKIRL